MSQIHVSTPDRKAHALRVISALSLVAPGWDVTVERHVEHRSGAQNRRLWALHRAAGAQLGLSEGECHEEMLCLKYGWAMVKTPWGERKVPLKRSSQRSVNEFTEFMSFVERTYAEQGIFIEGDG